MSKSDYAEGVVNEWLIGKTTAPAITTRYVALYTATPSDSGGGTEVTGGSYARKSTVAGDWNANSSPAGTISNLNAITFVTASASWGTVTHFGVFDALTSGNLLFWGTITTSKTIGSGDTAAFAAGTLVHTED